MGIACDAMEMVLVTDGRHKNGDLYKELLIPYLEDLHKKQVEQGLTTDGPDPEWKYPY